VLVHYHVFKNSGSSIAAILEQNFGNQMAYIDGQRHDSTVTNDDLLRFLHGHPEVRAVSSHQLRPPRPHYENLVLFDIIFVRHPLDRLRSIYDFYRHNESVDDPLARHAHREDMAGFMKLLLQQYPHIVNDAQVNYLANGGHYIRPADAEDLRRAVDAFCKAAVPGVTEIFDNSLAAAKYFLMPAFGALDFSHSHKNVSPGRAATLEERLLKMKTACGPEIYEALWNSNLLDLELVEQATREIQRRLNCLPKLKDSSKASPAH
jgi:hypothetical protein